MEDIAEYIDWSPFFWVWELKGLYPKIFDNKRYGEHARKLYNEGLSLLEKIIKDKRFNPRAIIGFYPANSNIDDIEIYTDYERKEIRTVFHFLRQQEYKGDNTTYLSLSDFIAPKDSDIEDYIGAFCVTAGEEVDEFASYYKNKNDDYTSILIQALSRWLPINSS